MCIRELSLLWKCLNLYPRCCRQQCAASCCHPCLPVIPPLPPPPPETYRVVYDANGGTGAWIDNELPAGSSYTVRDPAQIGVTRPGYDFIGWNTRPDGTGNQYEPGDQITINGDITLYAQWAFEGFGITYLPNGGTGSIITDIVSEGSLYSIRTAGETDFDRPGYTLIEWNTQPDGTGISYAPGNTIIVTEDLTLYAQWLVDQYTVFYLPNGGTGTVYSDLVFGVSEYVVRPVSSVGFTRPGYAFIAWNTLPDGSGSYYSGGQTLVVESDVFLYAIWVVTP